MTLLLILTVSTLCAQQGQWIWMKGTAQPYGAPTWGTQGVASPANTPPGITQCASWTDQQGRFWLFGGYDPSGTSPTIGLRSTLWMFDPVTVQWTRVKGSTQWDRVGVYGTLGVPDTANCPGARRNSFSWVDPNGDLWLFGGDGLAGTSQTTPSTIWGALNDLWKYNIATNTWTWMGGTQIRYSPGTYGQMGVAAASNLPSGRSYGNAWVDLQGNFWMFGGRASSAISPRLNEIWKYDITTNMWTWMKGGPNHPLNGNTGTKGVSAPTNIPAARFASAGWRDQSGTFWMYGGGCDTVILPNGYLELGDLWKYNSVSNEWTWVDGSVFTEDAGVITSPCQGETDSAGPGGLIYLSETWEDACGNLWLYGGGAAATSGVVNDLWCYQPSAAKWYHVTGGQAPYFGTMGVASPLNNPPFRADGTAWIDNSGSFWIFGGSGNAVFNDLWKFIPDYCCNPAMASCCALISVEEISGGQNSPAYPNPATTELHIAISTDAERVYLFDMSGRIVFQDNDPVATEGFYSLSLSGIASGPYLLRIEGPASCTDQQIVVQRP